MDVVVLDVMEVESLNTNQEKLSNGIMRPVVFARLRCSGGSIYIRVGDRVDIPQGWSGKAACKATIKSYVGKFRDDYNVKFCLIPTEILGFQKISKIDDGADILSSLGFRPAGQGVNK